MGGNGDLQRLVNLADEYRSGVPRTVTDNHVEAVVVRTLSSKPVNATHWSTRSMAQATGMSQPIVSRIWESIRADAGECGHVQVVVW